MAFDQIPPPTRLRVESLDNPLGIWTDSPRFSWFAAGGHVAFDLEVLNHAGAPIAHVRVGSITAGTVIPGFVAASRTPYRWRVRGVDASGAAGVWADSSFETTILDNSEWKAQWIQPAQEPTQPEPLYDPMAFATGAQVVAGPPETRLRPPLIVRQDVNLDQIGRARLYVTAHGLYEVLINGRPITDSVLNPGYEEYDKRMPFQVFDVAERLREGGNVVGITLADGWWAGRISFTGTGAEYGDRLAVIWQLEVDGLPVAWSSDTAVSTTGELVYSDLFVGEMLDARNELPGWAEVGHSTGTWNPTTRIDGGPADLVPFVGEPIRPVAELTDIAVLNTDDCDTIIDLKQNIAGRIRLTATGPAGTRITLEHTEVLDERGNFQNNIMGRNKDQTDVWILAGDGEEVFEPRFSFHGFRYVRVSGYPGELTPHNVVGVVIASDLESAGTLQTDHPGINRLHENVVWSQLGNFVSIPTDCPQRERAGWTGDLRVYTEAATNNQRVDRFLDRWFRNVRAAQRTDGQIPEIVPYNKSFELMMSQAMGFGDDDAVHDISSAGWSDAIIIAPLALYDRYGDLRILEENYDAMLRWHDYERRAAWNEMPERYRDAPDDQQARQRYLWNTGWHFGDWLAPSTVTDEPGAMLNGARLTRETVASICYYESTVAFARINRLLGAEDKAAELEELATRIADAFVTEYIADDGAMVPDMQGTYILALALGLVPEGRKAGAAKHLTALIEAAGVHLDTGFLSMKHLLPVLVDIGRSDLAYQILLQDTSPSWLYQVSMGATTIWEEWGAVAPDRRPSDVSMNHYAFGCVDDWLFTHVLGIRPTAPGYAAVVIEPDLGSPFNRVSGSRVTPYGEITVEVAVNGGAREVEVTVPHGVAAELVAGEHSRWLSPGTHTLTVSAT